MASWVQIANKALRRLGAAPIQALTDQTEAARAVSDVYEQVRDEVLARHPWNCALVRTSLAADSDAPTWGYSYKFTLPTSPYCLRVWRLSEDFHGDAEWKVIGRTIHTDEAGPLYIEYISRVTDPEQFSTFVSNAISAAIGAEIAYRLTNSTAKEEAMREWAEMELRHGRSLDAQEGTADKIIADEFLNERL